MILTALITAGSVLIAALVVLVLLVRAYNHEKRALLETLRLYFEPPDEETPSQFAQLTDAVGQQFSSKLITTLKASFMGMQSVDAKNQARLQGDLVQDLATQKNPMLGALLESFPAIQRRLAKNPSLTPVVEQMIAKMTQAGKDKQPKGNNDFAQRVKEYE